MTPILRLNPFRMAVPEIVQEAPAPNCMAS